MIIKEKYPNNPISDIIITGALSKKKHRSSHTESKEQKRAIDLHSPAIEIKETHRLEPSSFIRDQESHTTSFHEPQLPTVPSDDTFLDYDAQNREYVLSLTEDQIKEEIEDLTKKFSSKALDFLKLRGSSRVSAAITPLSSRAYSASSSNQMPHHADNIDSVNKHDYVKEPELSFENTKRYDLQSRLIIDERNQDQYRERLKNLVMKHLILPYNRSNHEDYISSICICIQTYLAESNFLVVNCDDPHPIDHIDINRENPQGFFPTEIDGFNILQITDVRKILC